MPDAVCIKAGSVDDKEARDFKKTGVEFYCKDRMGYSKAVEGAEQKPVSGSFFFFCDCDCDCDCLFVCLFVCFLYMRPLL